MQEATIATLFTPHFQLETAAGIPIVGATLEFFVATTTTPIVVYQDSAGSTPRLQPVTSDANGVFPPIFVPGVTYKVVLKDASGTILRTIDSVLGAIDADAIAPGSITEPKYATGSVSNRALALASVDEDNLGTALAAKVNRVPFDWIEVTGLPTDGTTNCVSIIQDAIDDAPDGSTIVIPPGTYAIKSLPLTPSDWWTADGDSAIDTAEDAAIGLRDRVGLTIIMNGVNFVADATTADGYLFFLYKCVECSIHHDGGEFTGNATLAAGAGEASAVVIARCLNCGVFSGGADRFYRNYFIIRSTNCWGRQLRSVRGGYFNLYTSGLLDVDLGIAVTPAYPNISGISGFVDCYANGGKFGNVLVTDGAIVRNTLDDAGQGGVEASHIRWEIGYAVITDNLITETSNQNSADRVDGIACAAGSNFATSGNYPLSGVVSRNHITGCTTGINAIGVRYARITQNTLEDFYRAGIAARSAQIGGDNYVLDAAVIALNQIGPFNASSTLLATGTELKAGLQVSQNDAVQCGAIVLGNVINADNRGSVSVTGTWYESATNLVATLQCGLNTVLGTGTSQLPILSLSTLPTSAPAVAGRFWNDAGTVKYTT